MLHGTLLLSYIGEIHYAFELWNKLQMMYFFYLTDFPLMTTEMKRKLNHERFTNGISTGDHIEDFGAGFVCLKVAANIAVLVHIY